MEGLYREAKKGGEGEGRMVGMRRAGHGEGYIRRVDRRCRRRRVWLERHAGMSTETTGDRKKQPREKLTLRLNRAPLHLSENGRLSPTLLCSLPPCRGCCCSL